MTQIVLPEWAQWVQALGPTAMSVVTALVAIAVAVVAYRQWKTAREKLVLDLFQRRFDIYVAAREGVRLVLRDGHARNNDGMRNVSAAGTESVFLFGDDVCEYLENIRIDIIKLNLAYEMMAQGNTDQGWPEMSTELITRISNFESNFSKLAAPYMRMDQKLR